MSFAQRVELHLVPPLLPVPCTGHVALSPSDPHSSFRLSLLFLLSVSPSHCSALVLLADGILLFFFYCCVVSKTKLKRSKVNWFVLTYSYMQ